MTPIAAISDIVDRTSWDIMDVHENPARCWFTNYKGEVALEGDFAPVDGNQIRT